MSAVRCDVVVVGAGAMGSATAWWLARRGVDTVLLEQFEQGHVRGSSHGATRIFRLAYDDRRYVRMAREALPLWRELEADAGRSLLVTTGGVDHGAHGSGRGRLRRHSTRRGSRMTSCPRRKRPNGGRRCGSRATSLSSPTPDGVSPTPPSGRCRTGRRRMAPTCGSRRAPPRSAPAVDGGGAAGGRRGRGVVRPRRRRHGGCVGGGRRRDGRAAAADAGHARADPALRASADAAGASAGGSRRSGRASFTTGTGSCTAADAGRGREGGVSPRGSGGRSGHPHVRPRRRGDRRRGCVRASRGCPVSTRPRSTARPACTPARRRSTSCSNAMARSSSARRAVATASSSPR